MPEKNNRRRTAGVIVLLSGAALFCLAVWMFFKTRGTGLLFIDSFTGRLLRYYWAVAAAAVVMTAVGAVLVRMGKRKATVKEESAAVNESAAAKESAAAEEPLAVNGPEAAEVPELRKDRWLRRNRQRLTKVPRSPAYAPGAERF